MERKRVIVVGVDGSPASKAALRWAVAHGSRDEAVIEAVMAYDREAAFVPATSMGLFPHGENPAHAHPARRLHDVVAEVHAESPHEPEIAEITTVGDPAATLVQASKRADLLVIGTRGHGAAVEVLLGSVAAECVRHSACPVVVIPPAAVR
jgi:nucleotide-binding universal stress UspA family protein